MQRKYTSSTRVLYKFRAWYKLIFRLLQIVYVIVSKYYYKSSVSNCVLLRLVSAKIELFLCIASKSAIFGNSEAKHLLLESAANPTGTEQK